MDIDKVDDDGEEVEDPELEKFAREAILKEMKRLNGGQDVDEDLDDDLDNEDIDDDDNEGDAGEDIDYGDEDIDDMSQDQDGVI